MIDSLSNQLARLARGLALSHPAARRFAERFNDIAADIAQWEGAPAPLDLPPCNLGKHGAPLAPVSRGNVAHLDLYRARRMRDAILTKARL